MIPCVSVIEQAVVASSGRVLTCFPASLVSSSITHQRGLHRRKSRHSCSVIQLSNAHVGLPAHTCWTPGHKHSATWPHCYPQAERCIPHHNSYGFFSFLGTHPWHMEVPRLGTQSELQMPACTTATTTRDLSRVCNPHHSSKQCWIPNSLSEARD